MLITNRLLYRPYCSQSGGCQTADTAAIDAASRFNADQVLVGTTINAAIKMINSTRSCLVSQGPCN